jgi:hypothetical protein
VRNSAGCPLHALGPFTRMAWGANWLGVEEAGTGGLRHKCSGGPRKVVRRPNAVADQLVSAARVAQGDVSGRDGGSGGEIVSGSPKGAQERARIS